MRKKIDSKVEREIAEILGHSVHKDMSVDEVLAMMLQVFLPVLMVFIISYFLFKSDVSNEIERTQDVYENPIKDNQRQTLTNALDKLENRERKTLGLLVFSHVTSEGEEVLDTTGLIDSGRLVDNELVKNTFISGCKYAKQNIPFPQKMAERWFNHIISETGISEEKEDYKLINDPRSLHADNRALLLTDIENRVQKICTDTKKLQSMAISELQKYYSENIDSLENKKITSIAKKSLTVKDTGDKIQLIELVQKLIKEHAKSVFKEQGVELLNNI